MTKVVRFDNNDQSMKLSDINEAKEKLEDEGYHEQGTIEELITEGKNFVLQTAQAHWFFHVKDSTN